MIERGRSRLHAWRPAATSRSDPANSAGRARGWQDVATSTPGKLGAIGILLILMALSAGVLAGAGTHARQDRIDTLRQHAEPLANAAQDLYSSLSVADASAGTAFLAGGLQPVALLDRYNKALGSSTAALTAAAVGADPADEKSLRLLGQIGNQLPVYAGLIATANANNRAGNPVGVNYLNEASNLMQATILPQAEQLYADQSAAVAALDNRNASLDWLPLAVTALTLCALIYFQVRVARQSRRVFNFGLLPATVAVGVMLAWLVTAGTISGSYSHRALVESSQPLSALTSARILAQQARTDETMNLLQRDSSSTRTASFGSRLGEISGLLDDSSHTATSDATAQLEGWLRAHQAMQTKLAVGDYAGAVSTTISAESVSSGTRFAALDADLSKQIEKLRDHGQAAVNSSYNALTLLAVGSGALAVAAAFLIGLGLWPRLSEYQ